MTQPQPQQRNEHGNALPCDVCGGVVVHQHDCRPKAEVLADIERLNKELEPFFDRIKDSKHAHLGCGWHGNELLPNGGCPKCGDINPFYADAEATDA
jgi:hypothetical protein